MSWPPSSEVVGRLAAQVAAGDPDRFRSVMACPVASRPALFVLAAAHQAIARAPYQASEPLIAEMRVQWWADVVARDGQGPSPAHEVAGPLHVLIGAARLPDAALLPWVNARRWECHRAPHADLAALQGYLEATGGGLFHLIAAALGEEPGPFVAAGTAVGLARYLESVPALRASGRDPMPPDLDLAGLIVWGQDRLAAAGRLRGVLARLAWEARPTLAHAAAAPSRVEAGRLTEAPVRRRLRLIAATLRG